MQEKTLSNGIRLIVNQVLGAKSVTTLVLVGAGSRYENEKNRGVSHFLEHMFFKGAKKYKNPKEVSETIDGIGGEFNAFTGKEYAGYYVKCAGQFKEIAFDVLSDMLLFPEFPEKEIEKEKGVILEEINMYNDMPKAKVENAFEEQIIGSQPLGWEILGTKEFINGANQKDFFSHHKSLYTPDNTVISLSGDISLEEGEKLSEKYFSSLSGKKSIQTRDLEESKNPKIQILNQKTEQSHLQIGVCTTSYTDLENFYIQRVLNSMLGGMMSSRMFLSLREEKGLCYYVYTNTDLFTDLGIFSAGAGVDNKRVDLAVEEILKEFKKITEKMPSEEELQKTKNNLVGKILLTSEDSEALAELYGKQKLLLGKVIPIEELVKEIKKVTTKEVFDYAKEFFRKENFYLAGIGPHKDKEKTWLEILEKTF